MSLDHLIFDKSGEIRMQKLEQSVRNIEEIIAKLEDGRIIREWFESAEALDMFKQLVDKIEFEYINSNLKYLMLLKGVTSPVHLDVELDILTSFNLLRIRDIPNLNDRGFVITSLGKLALAYLKEAD